MTPISFRRLVTCGAVLSVLVTLRAQEVFRARVDVVSFDVSVKDGNRPIKGLTSRDFVVLDDGAPQDIDAVSVATLPIDVTLVMDVSGSVDGRTLQGLKGAVESAARRLTPQDNLRLLAVSHQLRQVFDFQPGGSGNLPALRALTAGGATSLYDGIAAALMTTRPPERRHLIVALTDGSDTTSVLSADNVRDLAKHRDALVNVVSARYADVAAYATAVPERDVALSSIADATGGTATLVLGTGAAFSLGTVFTDAIDDFRTCYVVRYTSTVKRSGWHSIVVKLPKSGRYVIRARDGYIQ